MKNKQPAWAIIRIPKHVDVSFSEITVKGVYDTEADAEKALSAIGDVTQQSSRYFITPTRRFLPESDIQQEIPKQKERPNFLRTDSFPKEPQSVMDELRVLKSLAEKFPSSEKREFLPILAKVAEKFVAEAVQGKLSLKATDFDITNPEGESIEVKTFFSRSDLRRAPNLTIRTDVFADWYAVVVFSESLDIQAAWLIPRDVVLLYLRPLRHSGKRSLANLRLSESLTQSPLTVQLFPSRPEF